MVLPGSCAIVISPLSSNCICAVIVGPPDSGTADQVITARAGAPPAAGKVLKNTPPVVVADGSRFSHIAAMLGGSAMNRKAEPSQQRGSALLPSQTNPFDEMSIAVTWVPPGHGKLKPSALLGATVSSPAFRLMPRLVSKHGAELPWARAVVARAKIAAAVVGRESMGTPCGVPGRCGDRWSAGVVDSSRRGAADLEVYAFGSGRQPQGNGRQRDPGYGRAFRP